MDRLNYIYWQLYTDLNLCSVFGVVRDGLVPSLGWVSPETLELLLVLGQLVGQDVDIVANLKGEREGQW